MLNLPSFCFIYLAHGRARLIVRINFYFSWLGGTREQCVLMCINVLNNVTSRNILARPLCVCSDGSHFDNKYRIINS